MTQYVRVKFRNSPIIYDYLSDIELHEGDFAVVPATPGFAVVHVVKVVEHSAKATAWVVQRVDVEGYKKRMARKESKNFKESAETVTRKPFQRPRKRR